MMEFMEKRVLGRATLLMDAEPRRGAPGFINGLLSEGLTHLGYTCEGYFRRCPVPGDAFIPLASAERVRRLRGEVPAELAVYCERGLGICPPSKVHARRTAVLFHGLSGSPATWLGNPLIDRYWVLSSYMADVLTSLLALPDWRRRRCLLPEAFQVVDRLTPALPWVDAPEGGEGGGGEALPLALQRALDAGEDVVGHALEPGEVDWRALLSLLVGLNGLSLEHRRGRRFRLAVTAEAFALAHGASGADEARGGLQRLGLALEDVLIPVGELGRAARAELFQRARFGLACPVAPDASGFTVLESVFHGCPVYTPGLGNLRHVLPPGHGLQVGAPGDLAGMAARIFQASWEPQAREAVEAGCREGGAYLRRTFTRERFAESLREGVRRLHEPLPPPEPFEALELRLSPLVRDMDAEGHVVSDFQDTHLSPEALALFTEVRGLRAGQVLARPSLARELELLQGLFAQGVLTLSRSAAQSPPSVNSAK